MYDTAETVLYCLQVSLYVALKIGICKIKTTAFYVFFIKNPEKVMMMVLVFYALSNIILVILI